MQPEIFEDLVLAEASAWLTRLQGAERTEAAEAAFKAWLAEDAAHARAFARVTDTWDIIPGAARLATPRPLPRIRRSHQRPWMVAAACIACALAAGGGAWMYLRDPVYRTAVGEQRTMTLSDGTSITLNTDTVLTVSYRKDERRIHLERGEAFFDDVTNPSRPFIVQVGDRQVRALGTVFDVRRNADSLAILLIEGGVEVSQSQGASPDASPPQPTTLAPGERLTLDAHGGKVLDRPRPAEITAWSKGQLMFDNATLAQAIAEFDRYGGTPIELGDPALASLGVSGVFAIRDPSEFAGAVAQLHGLKVVRANGKVLIER
jgi:transmembrane sensor